MIENMEYKQGETPLDPDEMEDLKYPHVTTRGELNHLEQANIEMGLRWLTRQRNPELLTDVFARKLHKRLFGDVWRWAGSYRLTEKNIGVDPRQITVQLRDIFDDVQYWIDHDTYEPLEAAARFHHRVVKVHPFPNGNGRFSRIIADALLEKLYDHARIDWGGGFALTEENERRQTYLQALRDADGGDYDGLFRFVGYR
ncbi:MAG: mobile mystery protein B [Gammaproteobacteria bacterium]|nr:mobile mystery protein B [Gammaproteobacteria bacterium]